MIVFKEGNLFEEDVEALVNTVNCVGAMGRGVAAQFKRAFPENFRAYAKACKQGELRPGVLFVHPTGRSAGPRWIVNFPTKRHWRDGSRLQDVASGLEALSREIRERGIRSVALPPLGTGLGRLPWRDVRELIERTLGPLRDVRVVAFTPRSGKEAPTLPPLPGTLPMTPGRAALVGLMHRYLVGLMAPSISLLEVHKLMYFLQEAGEPLRLRMKAAPRGPYAENLRHVLHAIEGHLVRGYGDGGDDPTKPLELLPGAAEAGAAALEDVPATCDRFERVVQLVTGFESPFGLELLATVHWTATRSLAPDSAADPSALAEAIHSWGPGKRRFSEAQIVIAHDRLLQTGFLKN